MMAIADNYPGTSFTSNGLKLRFTALKEYSIDQVEGAAVKLIQTHRFNTMPTTADIINAMGGGQGDKAEIEAGKVLEHLHRYGARVNPSFNDPVTRHLMSTRWKWYAWASRVQESELKWWTRDFVRAYKAQVAGTVEGCFPSRLPLGDLARGITRGLTHQPG